MTEPAWDYPLRPAKAKFATWYVIAHVGVSTMILIAGAWSERGSDFGLGDPVTRAVLPMVAIFMLVVCGGLLVLIALRSATASLSLDGGSLLVPRAWLIPKRRKIPLENLRSATVIHTLFGRRLILETGTMYGAQCPSWWFESGDAVDRIHARIEASLLVRAPNEAERSRVVLQSHLGARTSGARPLIAAGAAWLVGFYSAEAWSGDAFDILHLTALGANATWLTQAGEAWRTVSAAALHFGPAHLAANLIALVFLAPQCFAVVGPAGCILIFGAGAISGATATAVILSAVSMGASPGIYGLLGAWLFWGFACGGRLAMPFAANARLAGLLLLLAIAQKAVHPATDVTAHIGGALGGAVAAWALTGRSLNNVGVAKWGPAIRIAATGVAVVFVVVPAWSFARGALADPSAVASHAIAGLDERDQKGGAGLRFGLELCFSRSATRAQVDDASAWLVWPPSDSSSAETWALMTSCFALRQGHFEPAWRLVRGTGWLQGNALASPIIASIARESVDAGRLPWTQGAEDRVDLGISADARHIEIRRREPGPGGMGVDFMVHSERVVIVVSAWLPESSSYFELGFEEACGIELPEDSVVELIDVIDGPGAEAGHHGRWRCAGISSLDAIGVVSAQTTN